MFWGNGALRVLLFGGFGVPNIGDEAILHGLSAFYSRNFPATRLHCITANPNYSGLFWGRGSTSHHFSDILLHLRADPTIRAALYALDFDALWDQLFLRPVDTNTQSHVHILRRVVAQTDLLHIAGGGFLRMPHCIEVAALLAMIAEKTHKPLLLSGSQIGPFDPETRALSEYYLQRAAYCDLRMERGMEELQRLNVRHSVSTDDALLLALAPAPLRTRYTNSSQASIRINVQLGYCDGEHEQNKSTIGQVIALLAAHRGKSASFRILQCFPSPPVSDFDALSPVIREFDLDPASVEYVDLSYMHPVDAISEVAKGDVTIASRMHAAVLSFLAGRPCYSLTHGDGSGDRIEFIHKQFESVSVSPFALASPSDIAQHALEVVAGDRAAIERKLRRQANRLANAKARELGAIISKLSGSPIARRWQLPN
ncbi:hypothetical protein VW23_001910 [Devosia insulae DS-56]|uniref:Polysaccharide pyruvyl transferase domain-containing protein n=1 Tax=Devosia insulae DS-56 TaxID=1116389 RepID=A0A1E5XM38_9HYPH|nr:polysaccharide pyruvyl transferase family protein [Devosia insulae]OEO29670.1 hypothetical protein VW23_001910 [Devosia insulae DS-56]